MTGAFEEYVASRWSRLVRSAVLMGADQHAAEDLVQTVLAKCYFSWGRVTRARDPDAYVHRALINALTDTRRRHWSGETPTSDLPEPAGVVAGDRVEDEDAVRSALLRLPTAQRAVIVLRYYADLTEPQTAEALGIAVGTVKSRASRAIAALEADPNLKELVNGPDA